MRPLIDKIRILQDRGNFSDDDIVVLLCEVLETIPEAKAMVSNKVAELTETQDAEIYTVFSH
jgi:hypothetical protein